MTTVDVPAATRRGTTNRNDRGSSADRRRRRAWLVVTYQSEFPGHCRCYRCGVLLFNPDEAPSTISAHDLPQGPFKLPLTVMEQLLRAEPLTVDRIIPGCRGGTYRRTNIRPACGGCNSETGGALAGKGKRK